MVFMVIQVSRVIFQGSRSVFMVFHGSRSVFMVFHGSRSGFMIFQGSRSVFYGFYGYSRFKGDISRFQVSFHGFSWF